jgi:hypothetical protein
MTTAVYDAWAADLARDRIVLAELQPAEQLGAFTRDAFTALPVRAQTSGGKTGFSGSAGFQILDASYGTGAVYHDAILIVRLGANATSISGVTATINEVAYGLTRLAGAANGTRLAEIWYLLSPGLTVPGVSIDITAVGGVSAAWECSWWNNVNQSTPFGTAVTQSATTATPSVIVSASATQEVLDAIIATGGVTLTVGAGQTQDANLLDSALANQVAFSREDGAASTTMSWTVSSSVAIALVGAPLIGTGAVYKVPWLRYGQTAVVMGGIYRRLDSVKENGTAYMSRASIALVHANLGSYFHETATDTLYVSTTTGTTPNAFAFIGAWFTIFLATKDPLFTDQPLYEPRLTGMLPQLKGTKPDEMFGATVWGDGQLEISNADTVFDTLARKWIWENKTCIVRIGGTSLGFADYAQLRTMRIVALDVSDLTATLTLETMANILNRSIPRNTIASLAASTYGGVSGVEQAVLGEASPILFGKMLDCPARLIKASNGLWEEYAVVDTFDSGALGISVSAAHAINTTTGARTTLNIMTDVSYQAIGTIRLSNATYFSAAGYELRLDIARNTAPWYPGTFAQAILTLCGEDLANIETAAFAALDTAVPYEVGAYLTVTAPASQIMRQLEQSGLIQVYVGTDGRWTCRAFDPKRTAVAALVAEDFAGWRATPQHQSVLSDVRVRWNWNPATDSYYEVSRSDSATQYGRETTDSHRIDTFLRVEGDAQELCDRYALLKQRVRTLIESPQRALALVAAVPGDFVTVTRDRAPNLAGAFAGEALEINEITVTLGPTIGVVVTLDDMADLLNRVGAYSDDTGADWSTASAAQKAELAFYADDDGYIAAGDVATLHRKIYW